MMLAPKLEVDPVRRHPNGANRKGLGVKIGDVARTLRKAGQEHDLERADKEIKHRFRAPQDPEAYLHHRARRGDPQTVAKRLPGRRAAVI